MTEINQTPEGARATNAWDALRSLYAHHLMAHLSYLHTLAARSIRG